MPTSECFARLGLPQDPVVLEFVV